jgi:hypothetical protein
MVLCTFTAINSSTESQEFSFCIVRSNIVHNNVGVEVSYYQNVRDVIVWLIVVLLLAGT